jgi:hypothetical protein
MFGDPEEGAGTTDAAAESSDNAAVEAADADGGSAGDDKGKKTVTIPFDEYMSLKTRREQENRSRAESGDRNTATDSRAPEVEDQRRLVEREEDLLKRLQYNADARNADGTLADPYAAAVVASTKRSLAAEQRMLFRMEMQEVPADRRELVRDLMQKRGFTSPFAAYKFMRGDEAEGLEAENRSLKAQLAERDKAKDKPRVESTRMQSQVSRGGSSKDSDREVTTDEWISAMSDPVKRKEFKAAKAAGKLTIVSASKARR